MNSTSNSSDKGSALYLTVICLIATLGGLLFGYDTGVISGAIEPLTARFGLSDFMKGWASGCVLIGCAAGVLLVGPLSDRFGRKLAMFLAALMFLISAIGTAVPQAIGVFILFRFLGGVGIGIASISTPMYIAEITPGRIRGRMVSVNQIAIVGGIAAAAFVNYFIAHSKGDPGGVRLESTARFAADDMLYLPALAEKLGRPSPTNAATTYLHSQLSASTRALLSNYQSGENPALQQALAEDFNRIIETGSLYQTQRFAGVLLSRETQQLLARNPQGPELTSLNRLLLLDACPQEIAKNQIQVWLTQAGWRWMFAAGILPSVVFGLLLLVIPESPRWLVERKRRDEAARILAKVGGGQFAGAECAAIQSAISQEKGTWGELFSRKLRRPLLVGIALAILQQITGINVFLYFGATIFKSMSAKAGVDEGLLQQIVINGAGVLFTLVAIATVDKWGRKPLMTVGAAGMGLSLVAMGVMAQVLASAAAASGWMLFFIVLYIACFGLSVGPVTWVILSEIFPTAIRGRALGVATFFLWMADYAVTQTFPLMNAKGSWLVNQFHHAFPFYVYGLFCAVLLWVVARWVPETKGRSLEEIESSWGHRPGERG
jgi:MFS family permease